MTVRSERISPPNTPPTYSPIPQGLTTKSCSASATSNFKDHLAHLVQSFQLFTPLQRQLFLAEIIEHCDNSQLTFLNSLITPRLKVDFLKELPPEIALHILSYLKDPATLAQAARISRYWNMLIKDGALWRLLCKRYGYDEATEPFQTFFKRQFSIRRAWEQGGKVTTVEGGFSHGLVTSLQFDDTYTVVGCDNHRVEVFDTNSGKKVKTLEGHEGGVWALQFKGGDDDDPERVLLSGGCDRDVRVWDLNSGRLRHVLRGHTSTVRCLKIRDKGLAVTGSRDSTLRVWDVQRGALLHVLVGHQASVRCIDIHGDIAISGSYDFTGRVWDLRTGQCKHVLVGHTLQIYTVVTNGTLIATGSMDAHIRIWSVETGACLATLHGHTSLVGQLQLSGTTLVSGGADGCLRVWDMETFECKQQFSAHDNSITCLQFNDQYILSAANDGKVKLWDIKGGGLIRNFTQSSKIVWKIQFNKTKAIVLMQRRQTNDESQARTIMEIHDFDLLSKDASCA